MLQNQSPFDANRPGAASANYSAGQSGAHANRFAFTQYLVRRKLLKLVGASFYVDDPSGNIILFAEQKGFKLKEDIRLFTGEDKTQEVLRIGARNWLDVSATYDVFDSASGQKIGALKRRGLKSVLRDEWLIMDFADREIGTITEDSMVLALIRRFIDMATLFLPQKFTATVNGQAVANYTQSKNPFLIKLAVDFGPDAAGILDRRLGIAAAILLSAIEGKQH